MIGAVKRVYSGSRFEPEYGFCRAVRIGDRILVAGTAPIPQDGSPTPEGAYEQARLCLEIMHTAIGALATRATILRTRMFITDAAVASDVGRAHGEAFAGDHPVATMVVVAGLLEPEWLVEMECEAIAHDGAATTGA